MGAHSLWQHFEPARVKLAYDHMPKLPEQLPQLDITFGQFKRSLKTFTFG